MSKSEMISVQNINTPGRVSNVNAAKYHAMRKALLRALPGKGPGVTQAEMFEAVLEYLPQELWPDGRKSSWWVKTVQLDLEAKNLVVRERQCKPLRWRRT